MDPWQPLLERLTRLKDSWPTPEWGWDGRFNTITSSFTIDLEPQARASAIHALPIGFTAKTIETASPELRALAERTGLRANQRLLSGDDGLFGLWWPWGGGDRITLRLGTLGDGDAMSHVRELFAVKL